MTPTRKSTLILFPLTIWLAVTLACSAGATPALPTNPPIDIATQTQAAPPPTDAPILPTETPIPATSTPQPPPALPVLTGDIAYSSQRDNVWQIIAMHADGSNETSLTAAYGDFARPVWSPDGQRLALRSEIPESGIAVMDVHWESDKLVGSQPQMVTATFADGQRWSPDGQRLLYVSAEGSGGWRAFMIDAFGTVAPSLVPGIPEGATDPDWSPDGKRIIYAAYLSSADQINDLYLLSLDGSAPIQLTNTPNINETMPAWSPDGSQIVYRSTFDGSSDLYIMNADGTGARQLTTDPSDEFDAAWSPDGTKIAFTSERHNNNDSNYEIYVINADGSGELRLTNNSYTDRWPTWRAAQPDEPPAPACLPGIEYSTDMTIPAGTRFGAPQPFGKVWRVRNIGSCAWTPTAYQLHFVEGERMGGPEWMGVPGAIQPGASIDLSISLTAPSAPGQYTGKWQLVDGAGQPVPASNGQPMMLTASIEVLAEGQPVLQAPLYFLSGQSGSQQIWRIETDARSLKQITQESGDVIAFRVSPADSGLAYVSQSQVIVADRDGANPRVIAALGENAWYYEVAWSSDGTRLAYASSGIHIYTLSTNEDRLLIADTYNGDFINTGYQPLAWSPDGSKLLARLTYFEGAEMGILSTADGSLLIKLPLVDMSTWRNDSQAVFMGSASYPGWIGTDPGLWFAAPGNDPRALIGSAFVWYPFQRSDTSLVYFMHQPASMETNSYSLALYQSGDDGVTGLTIIRSQPLLIGPQDTFDGQWTADGRFIVAQLVRRAIGVTEILMIPADETPPIFLRQEGENFQWGR